MNVTVLEIIWWNFLSLWAFGFGVLVAMRDCGSFRESYADERGMDRNVTIRRFYFYALLAAPFAGAAYVLIVITAMLRGKDCH